jgi:hypothetical protein
MIEYMNATDEPQVERLIKQGQDLIERLGQVTIPDGLGEEWCGGFEMTTAEYEKYALGMVDAEDGCPACGERLEDRLIWDADGEQVTCERCGASYTPERDYSGLDQNKWMPLGL